MLVDHRHSIHRARLSHPDDKLTVPIRPSGFFPNFMRALAHAFIILHCLPPVFHAICHSFYQLGRYGSGSRAGAAYKLRLSKMHIGQIGRIGRAANGFYYRRLISNSAAECSAGPDYRACGYADTACKAYGRLINLCRYILVPVQDVVERCFRTVATSSITSSS